MSEHAPPRYEPPLRQRNLALRSNDEITAALLRSEERLRLIMDTIPAHIAYFDKEWVFRYANLRYAEWFGLRREQVIDQPILQVIGAAVFRAVETHVARALAGEQVTYEYAMERAGGEIVYARSTLVPEIAADGTVLGCFVQAFDISEQRRTQAILMQAQKMEAIGQLTGGLAHDFNNLLTVVIGNLHALQPRLPTHDVEEFVEPALHAAQRGVQLVKRLLTFSRQQPLEPQPIEVNGLILNLARLIRRSLPDSIAISTVACEAELTALADPHQLENALINLIINARDAMPNGGRLSIESSSEHLDLHAAADLEIRSGHYVKIAVSDNGLGMDGSTVARMFEPFFTTKPFGHGSGLGMSMVYGFLKQSGGGVRVRSRQAQGTTVAILLPAAPKPSGFNLELVHDNNLNYPNNNSIQSISPKDMSDKLQQPKTDLVLLVDDEHDVRKITRMQLTELGFAVLEAENGSEAITMLEHIPDIRILITDMVMPGEIDGAALARLAKAMRPDLPIIIISAYALTISNTAAANAGDDALEISSIPFLPKPFSHEELAAVLATGVAHAKSCS